MGEEQGPEKSCLLVFRKGKKQQHIFGLSMQRKSIPFQGLHFDAKQIEVEVVPGLGEFE